MANKFNQILPTEIVSDILSRLPAESVLRCKSVCKTWKNLIQNPSFPQMHLARLNHPDSADSGKLSYVILKEDDDDPDYNNRVHYFEYHDNDDWNYATPTYRKIMFETELDTYIVTGSFNGLICIYGTELDLPDYGPAIIFNPVTKEYIVLPEFDSHPAEYETKGEDSAPEYHHLACGFGYLAETNEYKVVRIYMCWSEPTVLEVEVYTVGSGKGWRHVGRFDLGFGFDVDYAHTHGAFLNGCLHWRMIKGGMVVVFDLADEKFREHIPPPPMLTDTDDDEDIHGFNVIGVSCTGILYYGVRQSVEGQKFDDVWMLMDKSYDLVMNEKVQHQSWAWSKVTSLDQTEPFAFLDGGSVIRYDQGSFKVFCPRTSTWETILNKDISRQAFPYKHTLISLKELGEENVEIMDGIEDTDSSESDSD